MVLIGRMARENPILGAPKIHGELLKVGFVLWERSVSRYLRTVKWHGDRFWLYRRAGFGFGDVQDYRPLTAR